MGWVMLLMLGSVVVVSGLYFQRVSAAFDRRAAERAARQARDPRPPAS